MFPTRPNPKKAMKELKNNLLLFSTVVAAVRAAPYILHLYQQATSS
jgi:hypothetical protein